MLYITNLVKFVICGFTLLREDAGYVTSRHVFESNVLETRL